MNGDLTESYCNGNSIHHSYARATAIHASDYLTYRNNVGYHILGHAVFLEDGVETYNTIENNLMISTYSAWFMLQSDVSVASYYISNANNIVKDNVAAGGEFYGFWYEVPETAENASADDTICPRGAKLGAFSGNKANSMGRFGLRISEVVARKYPCKAHRDDLAKDPWAHNPSV